MVRSDGPRSLSGPVRRWLVTITGSTAGWLYLSDAHTAARVCLSCLPSDSPQPGLCTLPHPTPLHRFPGLGQREGPLFRAPDP